MKCGVLATSYCCWELKSTENSVSPQRIEYDVSELYQITSYKKGDFNSIEIRSSTIADFDDKKIKIKSGTYSVTNDDKVYLDYELVN